MPFIDQYALKQTIFVDDYFKSKSLVFYKVIIPRLIN